MILRIIAPGSTMVKVTSRWKAWRILAMCLLLLCCASVCMSDVVYVPNYDPDVSNLSLALNGGYPFTLFANNLYVNSSDNNNNVVLPLNGSVSTPYAFNDIDYLLFTDPMTGLVSYTPSSNGIIYNYYLNIIGHPRISRTNAYSSPGITPGLSGNFQYVPAGKYDLIYKVTDESTLSSGYEGDVKDAPFEAPVKVYVVDLKEQSKSVYMKQDDVYRIDLSTVPAAFPHENICYISVTWSGMPLPGQPSVSDLYTDAACLTPIQSDAPYGMSKTWQVDSVPQYIYFKMPSGGYKDIWIDFNVYDSVQTINLAHRYLYFTNTVLYCHSAEKYIPLSDYVMGYYSSFSGGIWNDREAVGGNILDGFAYEEYPYQNILSINDKNVPFVVKMGDTLKFTTLELADTGANIYNGDTDYITGAGNEYTFNSSHFDTTAYNGYNILSCRSNMESIQAVSNTVDVKYLSLPWKVTTSGGSNIAAGSCDIKVYVPFNTPLESNSPCLKYNCLTTHPTGIFESLLNISCKAASGASIQSEVFDLLWKKVQTNNIELLDGRTLTYWGAGNNTPGEHFTTDKLLEKGDGRCGHWKNLFVDLLRSQGLNVGYSDCEEFQIGPNPDRSFVYDDVEGKVMWHFGTDWDIVRLKQTASRFQGGGHPNSGDFQDHVINIYDDNYYDATCGAGPYTKSMVGFTRYLWDNVAIKVGLNTYSGDDLHIIDFDSSYYSYPIMH